MFSIRPQNPQPQNSYQSKRQIFRSQIRRERLHEYKNKIRHKLIFDNEVDANVLKNISLSQVLNVISKYDFPRDNSSEEVLIDDFNLIYDIQKPENATIYKAIEGLFLHITSSRNSHVINMLEQKHILTLAQILERKAIQMRPQFKQKSYLQGKTANDLKLSPIYQRILIILAQCAFGEALFFQQSIRYVVYVINQLLLIFPRHTRIVQACIHIIGVSLHNKTLVDHLLFLLSEQQQKECLLTRILDIFSYQVKHFNANSEHSTKSLASLLFFYEQIFLELIMNDLYPNMREIIFKKLGKLSENELNDKLTMALAKTLLQLYNQNFGNVSQIVLETPNLFDWVVTILHESIAIVKDKKFKQNIGQRITLCNVCFAILGTVFETPDPQDQYFISVTEFLAQQYDEKLDLLLQDALKTSEIPIIFHALQLIKTICNWGDFLERVYDNANIIIKLFYFCRNESFTLKKQAIFCLCNIIQGYFDGQAYHDAELCGIYDHLIEKFDFLEIMVENLDNYADVILNIEILRIAKILCYFWQSDPELGKYNRFWTKFSQNGGQIKLNIIITEERNKQMKELAQEILDNFVVTEEYEI